MMMYETIELKLEGRTAHIRLNRPDTLNALNVQMIQELCKCIKELSADEGLRIVKLSGNGGAFSAGGDIKEMLALEGEEAFFDVMEDINQMIIALYSMPQLTVAAIEGAAAGLGLSIALAADYLLCGKESKLAMNFIGVGLIPDGGGHFLLERRVGDVKARQLIWEGKTLQGEEALHIGLADAMASDANEAADDMIKSWLSKPTLAMIKTKKIYAELHREQLLKSLELEKRAQWAMRQTKDHQEGIRAFAEKRKPVFKGE
ncbi:MAG TPA: enoyl-CoA hydratase [Bacillaceae bacterium]